MTCFLGGSSLASEGRRNDLFSLGEVMAIRPAPAQERDAGPIKSPTPRPGARLASLFREVHYNFLWKLNGKSLPEAEAFPMTLKLVSPSGGETDREKGVFSRIASPPSS